MTKILITERNSELRGYYEASLKGENYEIISAGDGKTAIDMTGKTLPDVVVLDTHLPDMDIRDVMSRLLKEHPNLPIILNAEDYLCQLDFMSWCARSCIPKSRNLTELKRQIEKITADQDRIVTHHA